MSGKIYPNRLSFLAIQVSSKAKEPKNTKYPRHLHPDTNHLDYFLPLVVHQYLCSILLSSCRFYCFGQKNSYDDMLTIPNWYIKLGKTARARQKKYRSKLDKYLVKYGMKRDPKMGSGHFIGGDLWKDEMRKQLATLLKKKKEDQSSTDPPDTG